MEKKLPGVFVNPIDKELHNNEKVFVGSQDRGESINESVKKEDVSFRGISVFDKVRQIFAGRNYIYKADVSIIMKDGEKVVKRIIGKNGNYLITFDNERISMDSIQDIELIEKST